MRSKRKALLLCLLVVIASVYFAPKLLTVEQVQTKLINQVELSMGAEISMEKIRWRWGPLPHLTLFHSTIKNDAVEITLPKTRIYPNWKSLLGGKIIVGRLYLQSPQVIVKPSFYHGGDSSLPKLPKANITVDEGSIFLAPYDTDDFQLDKVTLEQIQLKVRHGSDHVAIALKSKASFAEEIALKVKLFDNKRSHSSSLAVTKFNLSKLLSSAYTGIKPLSSEVDFECDILGDGADTLSALFTGTIPDFSVQRLDHAAPLKFSNAKLLLEKKKEEFSVKIYQLALSDPETTFSGQIDRYFPADSDLAFYRLDLGAENIDLTAVRTKLLTLLGDNKITQIVCDIVRSGRAKSATYTFDAPLASFENVTAMEINVDVESAEIHVPGVGLDLHNASGPIIIKDGSIFGHSITTWLDNNYGSNGSFSVGLSHDNWLFTLDLDIDADLTTLPQTLHYLIDDELFRGEVLKFSGKGRKNGHLTIGDDLRDFIVNVQIDDLGESEVFYERISWPISFRGGSLTIDGDTAHWDAVSAIVGPHDIKEVSGSVSWHDATVPFSIDSFDALINAEELLAELNCFTVIHEYLQKDLDSVSGIIAATNGSLRGPFFDPLKWRYSLEAGMDIDFSTPHLPGKIYVGKADVHLNQDKFSLDKCLLTFIEGPLTLSMDLSHSYLSDWQGDIFLNGQISSSQGNWLREKKWIRNDFFPHIPVDVDNFKISWNDEAVSIFGSLSNKSLTGIPVEAVVDLTLRDGLHE